MANKSIPLLLLDKTENYLGQIFATIAERHAELNVSDVLMLETLQELEKGQRVIYKDELNYWHEYIVREVKTHHDIGIIYEVYCESSFYELLGDYIEDKRPTDTTATAALATALAPTRWSVGQVDDFGLKSTNFYQISAKEAVELIAEVWGAEIRPRIIVDNNVITDRFIDLKIMAGYDLGKRFSYSKDISAIVRSVSRADVVTALYGYGKGEAVGDGYGRRLTFEDINDGKAYVENVEAKDIWGRLNSDGTKSHVFDKVIFDNIEDEEELLNLTLAELEKISQPTISYSIDAIDLAAVGISHEGVELGDSCLIIDKEFSPELRVKARVVEVIDDLINRQKRLTFGNFIPTITDTLNKQEEYINSFRSRASVWDRSNSFNEDGSLATGFLDGVIDVLKNQITATASGWYTNEAGNLVFDALDGSSSMMLSGGGFAIANTKLPNGEWEYRTFGDGNGFVADMIIAGALVGGKVNFNLNDGTLLIGNSINDYMLYFDGTNLRIGGFIVSPYHLGANDPNSDAYMYMSTYTNPNLNNLLAFANEDGERIVSINKKGKLFAKDVEISGNISANKLANSPDLSGGYATTGYGIDGGNGIEFRLNGAKMLWNLWDSGSVALYRRGKGDDADTCPLQMFSDGTISFNSPQGIARIWVNNAGDTYINDSQGNTRIGVYNNGQTPIMRNDKGHEIGVDANGAFFRHSNNTKYFVDIAPKTGSLTSSITGVNARVTSLNAWYYGKVVTFRAQIMPAGVGFDASLLTMPSGYRPKGAVAVDVSTTQATADAAVNCVGYLSTAGALTLILSGTTPQYPLLVSCTYIAD